MAKVSIIILFTTFSRRICQSFGSPGIISGLALSATKDGETYADYYPFFQHQFDMLQYFLFGSRDTVTTQKNKITTPKGWFHYPLYEGVYVEKPKHKSFPTCFIYEGENTSAEVAVCCLFVTSVLSTFRDVV